MTQQKMSLYIMIGENIRRRIAAGLIKEGDKLPSCRECAVQLGVNPNTVQRAYTMLEEQGVVFTIAKKGVFVSSGRRQNIDRAKVLAAKVAELRGMGYSREEIERTLSAVYGREPASV